MYVHTDVKTMFVHSLNSLLKGSIFDQCLHLRLQYLRSHDLENGGYSTLAAGRALIGDGSGLD